jgi:heat shock protein HslJ
MRKSTATLIVIALLATPLCACKSESSQGTPPAVQLEDVPWRIAQVQGIPARPVPADAQAPYLRLSAADHRVTGSAGLNTFNGTYQRQGSSLRFGPLAMTRRAGPPDLMQQESAFARALMNTASWRGTGQGIEFLDAGGRPLVSFVGPK